LAATNHRCPNRNQTNQKYLTPATITSQSNRVETSAAEIVCAGIDALTDGTVAVYPNPTNGEVNFVITSPSVKTIVILDIVGKVIETKAVNAELTQFNLSNYSNGTYFYRLIDESGSNLVTEKLIRVN
jgi:hypothetical protein